MPLLDNTLFGEVDKVAVAIERLRTFCPSDGYWVGDSGGKDSTVVYDLVHKSGVKADYHHSLTTVDAPQTVHYIRKHHPDTTIHRPPVPLLKMMLNKQIPPLRGRRWCCSEYKERGGRGRLVVTGVRASESSQRARRQMVENCYRHKDTSFLHVIIDWTDADVWEYIRGNALPYNPLYDPPFNYERVGCVLCPMTRDIERQRKDFPRIYENWHRAILRLYDQRVASDRYTPFSSGEQYWQWWLNRDAAAIVEEQTELPLHFERE